MLSSPVFAETLAGEANPEPARSAIHFSVNAFNRSRGREATPEAGPELDAMQDHQPRLRSAELCDVP